MHELNGGRGVDRVVEVGGPGTIGQSLKAVAPGGEITSIAFLCTENPGIDFFALFGSWATLRPIAVGNRESPNDVARSIATTGIKPVIDRVFDFDHAKQAYAHLDSGSHIGKVVIRCQDDPKGNGR